MTGEGVRRCVGHLGSQALFVVRRDGSQMGSLGDLQPNVDLHPYNFSQHTLHFNKFLKNSSLGKLFNLSRTTYPL